MNCKEFKDKVVDLFDTTIDMQTQAECKAHMAECPECKAYYEELAEAFNALQPQETSAQPSISRPARKKHHLWRPIAAAAVFLLGFFTPHPLWPRLHAANSLSSGLKVCRMWAVSKWQSMPAQRPMTTLLISTQKPTS